MGVHIEVSEKTIRDFINKDSIEYKYVYRKQYIVHIMSSTLQQIIFEPIRDNIMFLDLQSKVEKCLKYENDVIKSTLCNPHEIMRIAKETDQYGFLTFQYTANKPDMIHIIYEDECGKLVKMNKGLECQTEFDCHIDYLVSKIMEDLNKYNVIVM